MTTRLRIQIGLASLVTLLVFEGAHWWLLIPAWALVILEGMKPRA